MTQQTRRHMKYKLLLIMALVWSGIVYDVLKSGIAWCYFEKHPVQAFFTYPVRSPKAFAKKSYETVRHPKVTMKAAGEKTLKLGKWMESSGFNGLMSGLGSAANIGTTALVGAKKLGN